MSPPPLLALRDVRVSFGRRPIFEDVTCALGRNERACLVGQNGSGKSTLLKALAGLIELDRGERFLQPGIRIAYLPQDQVIEPNQTVAGHIREVAPERHKVEAIIARFGLDGGAPLGGLSGGEVQRLALARAFVVEPDILLLDEPTNHLDLPTIENLEKDLADYRGALLVVSHDRTFLTKLSRSMLWLDRGRLHRRDRGFDDFERWTEEALAAQEKELIRLDRRLAAETRWLRRGITARRRRNQGRLNRLGELRAVRAAMLGDKTKARLAVTDGDVKSRLVIEAEKISKGFPSSEGERVIVRDFSTRVLRGDRVGFIGPNGAGKTTLLRLLTGEINPNEGTVRLARGLTPAYFDQRRIRLDPTATPWQTLCPEGGDHVFVADRPRHVVGYLKDFLFKAEQAKSPVASLSGGERNRLLLAKVLASPANLLVLDEPTNDLDMDTLDLLQETLADFEGTLLLVSHDRDFLDRLVTSTISLEGNGVAREYAGGYSDVLIQKARGLDRETKRGGTRDRRGRSPKPDLEQKASRVRTRLGYKDQRELDSLPVKIERLSRDIRDLESQLADPGFYARDRIAFDDAAARLEVFRAELSQSEVRWVELEGRREALAPPDRAAPRR